jgi:hypothetical protein
MVGALIVDDRNKRERGREAPTVTDDLHPDRLKSRTLGKGASSVLVLLQDLYTLSVTFLIGMHDS